MLESCATTPTPCLEARVRRVRGRLLALAELELGFLLSARERAASGRTLKSASFSFFFLVAFGIAAVLGQGGWLVVG